MKKKEDFSKYCRNFIKKNLPDYEGNRVLMCELGYLITEKINADCTATYSSDEAIEYLKNWWDDAGDYYDYEKDNFREHQYNPFLESEQIMVCMIINGINYILSQSEFIYKNWDKKITLNKKNIKTILSEIKDIDICFK